MIEEQNLVRKTEMLEEQNCVGWNFLSAENFCRPKIFRQLVFKIGQINIKLVLKHFYSKVHGGLRQNYRNCQLVPKILSPKIFGRQNFVWWGMMKSPWFDQVSLLGDQRFLCKYNFLCSGGIRRQKTPVDITAITQVRVVAVLRR